MSRWIQEMTGNRFQSIGTLGTPPGLEGIFSFRQRRGPQAKEEECPLSKPKVVVPKSPALRLQLFPLLTIGFLIASDRGLESPRTQWWRGDL